MKLLPPQERQGEASQPPPGCRPDSPGWEEAGTQAQAIQAQWRPWGGPGCSRGSQGPAHAGVRASLPALPPLNMSPLLPQTPYRNQGQRLLGKWILL